MIIIKTQEEIAKLREAGKRHARVLKAVAQAVKPGITTESLDSLAHKLITDMGDTPSFLHYQPEWAKKPFPKSICLSLNNEIVHGIPSAKRVIQEGDLVKVDIGYKHEGVFTDAAVTVIAGKGDATAQKMIEINQRALYAGIDAIRPGARLGDIGAAIESVWKKSGFSNPDGLCGHGVGRYIHEDPYVLNEGRKGTGELLKPGMVLAIEPMLNEGSHFMKTEQGAHVCYTADGKRSTHFEHTVLVTEDGYEILTDEN